MNNIEAQAIVDPKCDFIEVDFITTKLSDSEHGRAFVKNVKCVLFGCSDQFEELIDVLKWAKEEAKKNGKKK